jgi:hypothetical protein
MAGKRDESVRKESDAEGGAGAHEDQHACKAAHDAPRRRSCHELPDVRDERRHHEKRGSLHWWHREPERTHRYSWEAHTYDALHPASQEEDSDNHRYGLGRHLVTPNKTKLTGPPPPTLAK